MVRLAGLGLVGILTAGSLAAQQPPPPPPAPAPPTPVAVGEAAPGFSLMGGNRAGVTGPVSLEDFRDKTLVIAFFYRARSRG